MRRVARILIVVLAVVGLFGIYQQSANYFDIGDMRDGTILINNFQRFYKQRFRQAAAYEVSGENKSNEDSKAFIENNPELFPETSGTEDDLLKALEDDPFEIDIGDPYENYNLIRPDEPPYSVKWKVRKIFDGVYSGQLIAKWVGLPAQDASKANLALFGEASPVLISVEIIETYSLSLDDNQAFFDNIDNAGWKLIHTDFRITG